MEEPFAEMGNIKGRIGSSGGRWWVPLWMSIHSGDIYCLMRIRVAIYLWDMVSRTLNIEVSKWREGSQQGMAMIYSSIMVISTDTCIKSEYLLFSNGIYLAPTMWTQWTKETKPVLRLYTPTAPARNLWPHIMLNMPAKAFAARGCTLISPLGPFHAFR